MEESRYDRALDWFFGTPAQAEAFVRKYGTVETFEQRIAFVDDLLEQDENRKGNRKWRGDRAKLFIKTLLTTGQVIATTAGSFLILRGLWGYGRGRGWW